MKGFIEIDDASKRGQKILINIKHIVRVMSVESTPYKSQIDAYNNSGTYAIETYEEIKKKIEEAGK